MIQSDEPDLVEELEAVDEEHGALNETLRMTTENKTFHVEVANSTIGNITYLCIFMEST